MKKKSLKLVLRKATISKNLNSIKGGGGTLQCPTLPHMTCPTLFTNCKQITCANTVIEG